MYVFDIRMQLAIVKWHFVFVMYANNRITGALFQRMFWHGIPGIFRANSGIIKKEVFYV
jgi:hypothetical protein